MITHKKGILYNSIDAGNFNANAKQQGWVRDSQSAIGAFLTP